MGTKGTFISSFPQTTSFFSIILKFLTSNITMILIAIEDITMSSFHFKKYWLSFSHLVFVSLITTTESQWDFIVFFNDKQGIQLHQF